MDNSKWMKGALPDNGARLPLANLSKSDNIKSPPKVPPKRPSSPLPKPAHRRGGSNGLMTTSSPPPAPSSPTAAGLEQPYTLQRSNSTQTSIHSPSPDHHRRTRSYSSSSVANFSSPTSKTQSDSLTSLFSSLEVRRHKYGEKHPKVGSAWNRIGSYFFRVRQFPRALDAFKHGVACYPVGEPNLASSYSNIGAVYWASGQPDKAITFLEKALDIHELNEITEGRDPDENLTVATVLYQMGLCNTLRKHHGEALACLMKCQKIQAALLPPRDIQIGRTLDAIGKVHFFKEDYATALQCHEEARRIKSASGENDASLITSFLNIAAVHHETKNWNAALKSYTKVLQLQKSELLRRRNQKGQALVARAAQELGETMQLVGDLHRQMDKKAETDRFYKEATLLFEEAGLPKDDPRVLALK